MLGYETEHTLILYNFSESFWPLQNILLSIRSAFKKGDFCLSFVKSEKFVLLPKTTKMNNDLGLIPGFFIMHHLTMSCLTSVM